MDRCVLRVKETNLGFNLQNMCKVLVDHATVAHHHNTPTRVAHDDVFYRLHNTSFKLAWVSIGAIPLAAHQFFPARVVGGAQLFHRYVLARVAIKLGYTINNFGNNA